MAPQDTIRILGDSQIHALRKGARDKRFGDRFQIEFVAPGRMIRAFTGDTQDEASTSVRGTFFRKIHGWKGPLAFSFGGGEHARTWTYTAANRWHLAGPTGADDRTALSPGMLEAYVDHLFRGYVVFVAKQTAASGIPGAFLSFPPVIGDTKLLADLRQQMAAKTGATVRVDPAHTTPADLRRETWTITEKVKRRLCADHELDYVPPPPSSLTEDGFLRPEFAGDAFHANSDYGNLVLQTLADWPWKRR